MLYSDSSVEVGAVCVTVNPDAENVFLDYLLIDGWTLDEVFAWIGDDIGNLPVDGSGNPQVSVFPHTASNLGGSTEHSFTIPFSELAVNADTFCSADVVVAAGAVVSRTITGDDSDDDSDDGKSDKSGKSEKSGKSGKSGQSDKSAKSDKSDKSGKAGGKNGKASKSTKSDKSAKSGQSGNTLEAGKGHDKHSGKVGHGHGGCEEDGRGVGHKDHSGVIGHGHEHNEDCGGNGGTETVVAWAGSVAVGDGFTFSFTNDFCGAPVPMVVVPQGCSNVFARGIASTSTPFSPVVGVAENISGYLNTVDTAVGGFNFDLLNANAALQGTLLTIVDPLVTAPGTMLMHFGLNQGLALHSANVYLGAAGSFDNVSPLLYGVSVTGAPDQFSYTVAVPSSLPAQMDMVIHAVICPPTN